MASALIGNSLVHDLPTDKVAGTWSSDGTPDAAYPLTNIDDVRPWKPVKYTSNPSFLLIDFGSAKRVDLVAFIHCNFDTATIHVQMNATNSWGAPTVDRTVTIPAADESGMPGGPFADMTADPGYTTGGLRWLRITTANTALLSLGLVRLVAQARQLTTNIQWGHQDQEQYPVLEFASEGSVQLGYALGVRNRMLTAKFDTISDATLALLRSWFRACNGRALPSLLILDPTVNDAWWVKWGDQPTWLFQPTHQFLNLNGVPAIWAEVGRGLKP